MGENGMKALEGKEDEYIHGMDWGAAAELQNVELSNYGKYQYDLVARHIGRNILEVGSGARIFTHNMVKNLHDIERIISIEPSSTLTEIYKDKYVFPEFVKFEAVDMFDMRASAYGLFDTIILIHVLEHIEDDRSALTHLHSLLAPGGRILIEVPAMPFLFSQHDEMLGHFRRYNKKNFKAMIDTDLFEVVDLWFQDEIGMIGSFIYFKIKKVRLKSREGIDLVKNRGTIYDKYVIPFEKFYGKYLRFPFGLSLTGVLRKK